MFRVNAKLVKLVISVVMALIFRNSGKLGKIQLIAKDFLPIG